jgi:TolB-like protein/Flp pilus assembly protein TadD
MSVFSELKRRNVFRVGIAYFVTAWLVAQVAELAFDSFGAPDWVMKSLIFLMAIGLPFALIFAWAFELTPEGIKREKDVDRSQSITQQTGRKLNYTIIGVLAIALALSLASHQWTAETPKPVETRTSESGAAKSIAVLPFVNMSDDPSNEYFSDGISEELLNVLVRVEGLRVASRTSSFSFKGKDTPIPEIANALNVEHVLEGSVRKAGNTVRVTAQLIDVKTDSHLWSETYDRKLEDIFVIQDEISAHIVEALKVALGAGEAVRTSEQPTQNLAAYEDYLRGRHFWSRRGENNIRKAIELFERATETDPGFARAWSSLAVAHITLPAYSVTESLELHYALARRFAEQALSLDATLADAHAALGDMARVENSWIEAESHYRQAIQLEPNNSTGYLWYAEHLSAAGHFRESLINALKALELDPFNAGANAVAADASALNGDRANAEKYARAAIDLGHPWAIYGLAFLRIDAGDLDAAERTVETEITSVDQLHRETITRYIAAVHDPGYAESWFAWVRDNFPENSVDMALDNIRFGRTDKAIEMLDGIQPVANDWIDLWKPVAEPIRRHPIFAGMLTHSGLVEYWEEYGWPDLCSRDGDKITCR